MIAKLNIQQILFNRILYSNYIFKSGFYSAFQLLGKEAKESFTFYSDTTYHTDYLCFRRIKLF